MVEHYFSAHEDEPFVEQPLRVRLGGAERDLVSAPGIFSPKALDKGTAVLLDEVPALPESGSRFLDVGCGWGPIALSMGLQRPDAEVVAVDVNRRSLELTRRNAARLGLTGIRPVTPEAVDPRLRFDAIWSNPPIRVGKQVLHELLMTWLVRLAPAGQAHLVVQKNLGADSLQRWLDQALREREPGAFDVDRAATAKGFRILRVTRAA